MLVQAVVALPFTPHDHLDLHRVPFPAIGLAIDTATARGGANPCHKKRKLAPDQSEPANAYGTPQPSVSIPRVQVPRVYVPIDAGALNWYQTYERFMSVRNTADNSSETLNVGDSVNGMTK